jgi:hypothetical protein
MLIFVGCSCQLPVTVTGTVASATYIEAADATFVAIVPSSNSTPVRVVLAGMHPEFWHGEYVAVTFISAGRANEDVMLLKGMERVGADRP